MNRLSPLASLTTLSLLLTACGGGGGGGGGFSPIINPTQSPTQPGGSNESLFQCPTSTTNFAHASSASQRHQMPARNRGNATDPNTLIVTYASSNAGQIEPAVDSRMAAAGATKGATLQFKALGKSARVVHVSAANQATLRATLASTPGVLSVSDSHRIFIKTVTTPFVTDDPYFHSSESATVPGQWDMHQIGLEYAFGYSQSGNGSGITNAKALGSSSVRLAVIDTGMDVTHPDLSGDSIVRTRCFITDENNVQSIGADVTDPQGHGTDVTGIAAAGVNNGFGFVGAGGNVSLMLYRVFPTADDSCLDPTSTNAQCGAADVDVASAINDAVINGANVISLSLGGGSCVGGADPSTIEGNAVANAIASNVIVVAASGNEGGTTADAPGCDPGVISVGATGYNDGLPNGSAYTGSNREYVASYSNLGATLVAPGGDPSGNDTDNLHWIENIWTSTPYDANYAGFCTTDYFGEANDCRTEIAGTSMSTPHVAGAAALILSVNSAYQSPASMKQLLCSTADNINDTNQGCGRLNVYRAMATALHDPTLP